MQLISNQQVQLRYEEVGDQEVYHVSDWPPSETSD
jgi:hypothetical protein